jgi:acyl carrier protein
MNNEQSEYALTTLKQIWSDILDVPSEALTPDSDFFELGGGSMLLLSLHARVCHEFAVELSMQEFLASSRLGEMAGLII